MRSMLVHAFIAFITIACDKHSGTDAHAPTAPVGSVPNTALRSVDWANREYPGGKLENGQVEHHFYRPPAHGHDTVIAKLGQVAYGDLDRDGVEEAAVVIQANLTRPDAPTPKPHGNLHVFAARAGAIEHIASYDSEGVFETVAIGAAVIILTVTHGASRCTHALAIKDAKLTSAPPACVQIP